MSLIKKKLDSITFDKLLERGRHFETSYCTFDISGVSLVTPSALVQMAAACHAMEREGRRAIIIVDDNQVHNYLRRAGFTQVIKGVAKIENRSLFTSLMTYPFSRGTNPFLLEVTQITSSSLISDLLDRILSLLTDQLKYRKADAFDVTTAISEVCQNIFDHNHQTCGFIAMQAYGKNANNRFIEIGISDYGDGLVHTLRRNPRNLPIESDLAAIQLAIKSRVSGFSDDPTRGTGLSHMLNIAFKHEGTVQIRSGKATMRFRMDQRRGWGLTVAHMPGVQVTLTLKSKERG